MNERIEFSFFFGGIKNAVISLVLRDFLFAVDSTYLFRNSLVVGRDVAWISLSSKTTDAGVKRLSSLYLRDGYY